MQIFWTWIEKIRLYKYLNTHPLFGKLFNREVLSYLLFGALTTVVSVATFWLPDRLFAAVGYPGVVHYLTSSSKNYAYMEANVISWICAVAFAFVTNKLFVFESRSKQRGVVLRELASFVGGRLTTLFVDLGLMFVLVTLAGMREIFAKILVQFIIVLLNYIISKWIVFRRRAEPNASTRTDQA